MQPQSLPPDPLEPVLGPVRARIEDELRAPQRAASALEQFFANCQKARADWSEGTPAGGAHPAHDPRTVLLALVATDYATRRGRRLTGREPAVRKLLEAVRGRFELATDLARLLVGGPPGSSPATGAWGAALVLRAQQLAAEFEARLAPTRLGDLRKRPPVYRGRIETLVARCDWDDARLQRHVETVLTRGGVTDPADITRLLARTGRAGPDEACEPGAATRAGLARLRLFPDDELEALARNFATWDPVVRAFEPQEPAAHSGQLVRRVAELCDRLAARVRAAVAGPRADEAEDLVHDVLTNGLGDYTYETGLDAWLFTVAVRRALVPLPPALPPVPPPAPVAWPEDGVRSAAAELWPWHVLIRSTFPRDRWPELDVLWGVVVDEAEESPRRSLEELAERMGAGRGAPLTPMAVAMLLRRYRQKWWVVRTVLEAAPADRPDDRAILNELRAQFYPRTSTVPPGDEVSFRRLAALARVGRENGTPVWATFATLVIDAGSSATEAQRVVFPDHTPAPNRSRLDHMLQVYGPRNTAPATLRSSLNTQNLRFWASAVAQLFYVDARDAPRIAEHLRATDDERRQLERALRSAPPR